jgi:hypothetical protein
LQRFDDNGDCRIEDSDEAADLYHFAQLVAQLSEPDAQAAANDLLAVLDGYIVYNDEWSGPVKAKKCQGSWNHDHAYGVSVTVPRSVHPLFYTSNWLDFAEGADWTAIRAAPSNLDAPENAFEWGPLLVDLMSEFNPDAPDVAEPPDPLPPLVPVWPTYLPVVVRDSG